MKKTILSLIILVFITSCKSTEPVINDYASEITPEAGTIKLTDQMIMSTLWYQLSAERHALCYQAFNLAKLKLEIKLNNSGSNLPPVVIVDIDETMLDNSPFEGKCIETGIGYTPATWNDWTEKATALPVTGAVEFCKFAESKGVEIFYISNRKTDELISTMNNMKNQGFPFIREANFMMKTNSSGKEERRNKVKENYNILLLIGDNLIDFDDIFESRQENFGINTVNENKNSFGDIFILLPNPMYGDWESAIYKGVKNYTDQQKDSVRRSLIISY